MQNTDQYSEYKCTFFFTRKYASYNVKLPVSGTARSLTPLRAAAKLPAPVPVSRSTSAMVAYSDSAGGDASFPSSCEDGGKTGGSGGSVERLLVDARRTEADETGSVEKVGRGGKSKVVADGRGGGGGGRLVAAIEADAGGGGTGGVGGRLLQVPDWRFSNVFDDVDEVRDANVPTPGNVAVPLGVLDIFGGVGGGGSFFGVTPTGTVGDRSTEPTGGSSSGGGGGGGNIENS